MLTQMFALLHSLPISFITPISSPMSGRGLLVRDLFVQGLIVHTCTVYCSMLWLEGAAKANEQRRGRRVQLLICSLPEGNFTIINIYIHRYRGEVCSNFD